VGATGANRWNCVQWWQRYSMVLLFRYWLAEIACDTPHCQTSFKIPSRTLIRKVIITQPSGNYRVSSQVNRSNAFIVSACMNQSIFRERIAGLIKLYKRTIEIPRFSPYLFT
jgi:hypothetical protein